MRKTIYGTASVEITTRGAVADVRISGVVIPGIPTQIVRDNAAWFAENGLLAVVVHLDRAVFAIGQEQMLASAVPALQRAGAGATPTAIVAAPEQIELFKAHVAFLTRSGFPREVFTSAEQAHAWAARQAQVRAYWIEQHSQAKPEPD